MVSSWAGNSVCSRREAFVSRRGKHLALATVRDRGGITRDIYLAEEFI